MRRAAAPQNDAPRPTLPPQPAFENQPRAAPMAGGPASPSTLRTVRRGCLPTFPPIPDLQPSVCCKAHTRGLGSAEAWFYMPAAAWALARRAARRRGRGVSSWARAGGERGRPGRPAGVQHGEHTGERRRAAHARPGRGAESNSRGTGVGVSGAGSDPQTSAKMDEMARLAASRILEDSSTLSFSSRLVLSALGWGDGQGASEWRERCERQTRREEAAPPGARRRRRRRRRRRAPSCCPRPRPAQPPPRAPALGPPTCSRSCAGPTQSGARPRGSGR
jgi:hypothetical protein